jgi:hypothetical protein
VRGGCSNLRGLTGRGGRCWDNLDTIEGSGGKRGSGVRRASRGEPGGEEAEGSCNLPRCGPRVPRVPSFLPRRSTLQVSTSAPPPRTWARCRPRACHNHCMQQCHSPPFIIVRDALAIPTHLLNPFLLSCLSTNMSPSPRPTL